MEETFPPDSEQVFRHQEPISDANKRYLMICEENARAQMSLYSPQHNSSAQRIGRLYGAGMNHRLIGEGVGREVDGENEEKSHISIASSRANVTIESPHRKDPHRSGLFCSTTSLEHSTANKHEFPPPVQSKHLFSAHPSHTGGGGGVDVKYVQAMKTASALGHVDKLAGGKYHVPNHLHEPFAEPLTGLPQRSQFTKTTPLMWNLHKTKEIDNSACTKSLLFRQSVTNEDSKGRSSRLPSSFIPTAVGGAQHYNRHAALQVSEHLSFSDNGNNNNNSSSSSSSTRCSTSAQSYDESRFGRNGGGDMQLSALQQTLVDCGKLRRADEQISDKVSKQVYRSLQADVQQTKKHALWLQHKQQHVDPINRRGNDNNSYIDSQISGLQDNAGSFFTEEGSTTQEFQHNLTNRNMIRQRAKSGLKTLRQHTAHHSSSSGDLSKYKKNVSTKSGAFRGNSSVMKVKGSRLEEATQSRILASTRSSEADNNSTHSSKLLESMSKEFKRNSTRKENELDKSSSKARVYSEDLAEHLDVTLVDKSSNPHRDQFRGDSEVKFASHQSLRVLKNKIIDPKLYTKSTMNAQYGGYNVTVKEPIVRDLPSKDYISKAMTQISKQMVITYSTRIVETGAALRALQDMKHRTPGVAAILELNRAFIAAASFNPSPWEVSRAQFQHVMNEQLPWFPMDARIRLASAYDPRKSGVIKYARMTAALMAGNRPAMSILMTNISRDPDKVDGSGNVFLLRLLHSLYEDCDGGVVEEIASTLEKNPQKCMQMAKPNSNTGLGIKLEDVPEILSVCASNLDEETLIKDLAMEVVQVLYEYGKRQDEVFADLDERYSTMRLEAVTARSVASSSSTRSKMFRSGESGMDLADSTTHSDRLFAKTVLKFDMLKSISSISRVSQNAFIKCVARHPLVMNEFGNQVERFRELITPYQVMGSISYEDSLTQNSQYGTLSSHYNSH